MQSFNTGPMSVDLSSVIRMLSDEMRASTTVEETQDDQESKD